MLNTAENNIFIIIPAYNEKHRIINTLNDLLKYDYQIIVVDDCSIDNTYQKVKGFIQEKNLSNKITLLKHRINRGQGAALQTGTNLALKKDAKIIVHFDADGQFLAQEIQNCLQPILDSQADIVLGSRFLQKNYSMPWLKKYLIHPISKLINYFFTGLKLTDAHCGFRAMHKQTAQKIQITQDRMSHNTEIIAQIKKLNLKYKEIPVTVIYHEFGQGINGGFKIVKELFLGKLIK